MYSSIRAVRQIGQLAHSMNCRVKALAGMQMPDSSRCSARVLRYLKTQYLPPSCIVAKEGSTLFANSPGSLDSA